MGYYTGSGVVTGGSESVNVLMSVVFYGAHNWYQKDQSTSTTKNGVSLSTAQAASGDCSMNLATHVSGTITWYCPNGYGSKSEATYSRIADSNLYALTTTAHTIKCKFDNNSWIG